MQPPDGLLRWLRRIDTQAAVFIAVILLVGVAIQSATLYAFVGMEALEAADQRLAFGLQITERRIAGGGDVAGAVADLHDSFVDGPVAVRVLDTKGDVERVWGPWPDAELVIPMMRGNDARNPGAFRLLSGGSFLVGTAALPTGRRMEFAMPLSEFAGEAKEIGNGLLLVSFGSGMLAILVAMAATTRAFRPLRQATKLLRNIDAQHLGQRLPTLGTGDPVDLHAQTLNKVLADIDSAFSRLRSFSGDVAHELRTPLNRIGNVADVALVGNDDSELRSALETVQRTSQELTEVIQSLLFIAEIDDGRFQIQRQPFDAEPFIQRSVSAFAPLFEEKGIQVSIDSDPVSICGDRGLLDRVLVNLLDNALHHTPPGTRVEVHCRQTNGDVTIGLEDSGPGIPPADRERVFDRFVRLGTSAKGPSVGLGLALSRAIARSHGGDLSVESSILGGARFVWRLPST